MNAIEVADKETAMWQSYYEKKPVKLFIQSAALMRSEFHFPFWRSYLVSYYAAAAAFTFKDGSDRKAYAAALPDLTNYFRQICDISIEDFNADSAAKYELEWWIIRRERDKFTAGDWQEILCKAASTVYHVPPAKFSEYAHLRVEAMLLRDEKAEHITDADWQHIDEILRKAWTSFSDAISAEN